MGILDLRSDTFTKPNDEMRRLMATAEVGDDVFGEDPTINKVRSEYIVLINRRSLQSLNIG